MPKRTLKRNKSKRAKKLGFMARMSSRSGRNVLKARRKKRRSSLAVK